MYATGNPKTKKELKTWVENGKKVRAYSPGPFDCPTEGRVCIEGPHYPQPHRWYATVTLEDGIITSVK